MAKKKPSSKPPQKAVQEPADSSVKSPPAQYPRHSVDKALRIPKAILEQNAGKPCTVEESAAFLGVGAKGVYTVEVSSGLKYGFLERPSAGLILVTDRAKRIIRPQDPQDALKGLQDAVVNAPIIADVYGHYRGENLPDSQFFANALADTFKVPVDKVAEFQEVFFASLRSAQLITEHEGKYRVVDVSHSGGTVEVSPTLRKLERSVKVEATDTCFVMMPFAAPLGDYYEKIYKPAIEKAGLRPVRADNEIFGTGKIIDQIWSGINTARVLNASSPKRKWSGLKGWPSRTIGFDVTKPERRGLGHGWQCADLEGGSPAILGGRQE